MKVSIVIPAHNEQDFIEDALVSVLAQEYDRDAMEAIVVDNASTDRTAERASAFAERNPEARIQVVDETAPGVGRAKNSGAEAAAGEILIFLDADSRMEPGLVRGVADAYESGARIGSMKVLTDSAHWIDRAFFGLMEFGKERLGVRGQMLYCETRLFRELGGFNGDLRLGEDVDLLRRARSKVRARGGYIAHVRDAGIITSPRRLHRLPMHLAMLPLFGRWVLAFVGIGRTRKY